MTLDERCVRGAMRFWTDRYHKSHDQPKERNPYDEPQNTYDRCQLSVANAIALLAAAPAAMAETMGVKMSGMFEGRSNHETAGTVSIIEKDGRTFVDLGEDFSLDGGPDPRVNFGKDGVHDADAYLGALVSMYGKQRYAVPPRGTSPTITRSIFGARWQVCRWPSPASNKSSRGLVWLSR